MSKIEDFKNAPVGATATGPDGYIACKTGRRDLEWSVYDSDGWHRDNYRSAEMVRFTLNPAAPTTARGALELAWDLAHKVKEGQHILEGTRYLELYGSLVKEYTAQNDVKINSGLVQFVRTLEPLSDPEPKPDWLDALAVFAYCGYCSHEDYGPQITLHGTDLDGQKWECTECQTATDWSALSQVTPLYPKEGQEK